MIRTAMKGLVLSGLLLALVACQGLETERSILLPVADDPAITFKIWFQAGSQNDPPGKEGLAALTGLMISEGATENNALDEILKKLYPLAASYGVSVDREMTVLTGRTHKDNLEAYYELFTDAYLRPAFSQEDFDRLKTDTLNYLENSLRSDSDEELGKAALYSFVFEGTRYAHPSDGTVEGLRSITLDDVKQFYATYYTRANAVPALGGGYDKSLVRRFTDSLDQLPQGKPAPVAASSEPPSIKGVQVLLVDKPGADASISAGFPIDVKRGEREFYALWVANSWLGEHRNSSSHLYQVIRKARGMNYGDYSYIEAFTSGGRRSMPPSHVGRDQQIFEIWIRTLPNEQAHFALRAALRELRMLVDNGMTREQFELTRSFLTKYVLHFADTTSGRLAYAVDDRYYDITGEGHLDRFRRIMGELTLEEVNAAIRKHLQYDNIKIAMVTGDAAGLATALAADTASPMTYESEKPQKVLDEDKLIASLALEIDGDAVRVTPVVEMFEK